MNEAQNEIGFWNFPELFQPLIQRVVLRVGIEPSEQLRGRRLLQLNRGNESENLLPLGFDKRFFDVAIGEEFVALLLVFAAFTEPIELLAFERLNPRGKRESQEMQGSDNLAIPMGIC